jgi:large conductance mechanosensitive channel
MTCVQVEMMKRRVPMSMWKEFKTFAMRGNVMDMAVGIIIGGAFGKIVSSLVSNVIMPPIGMLLSDVDFSQLAIILRKATDTKPAVTIGYGMFINTVINFIIVAFAIFVMIKTLNSMKKKEEAKPVPPPAPSAQEVLLTEIRDILKRK